MRFPAAACLILAVSAPFLAQEPGIVERRLSNGMRVLVVERPSGGMIHAALFSRGGRSDTGGLPPGAAELLARSLFGRCEQADLSTAGEVIVREEESLYESLLQETLQRRRSDGESGPPEVAALHARAFARLKILFGDAFQLDLMEGLGVTARETVATPDFIRTSCDLPAAETGAWAKLEAQRLGQMHLYRFPLERQRWLESLRRSGPAQPGLSPLLGTAFVGSAYASALDENPGAIAGLSREDVKGLAWRLFAPDRMLLVLVGDLSPDSALPLLEASFGRLGNFPEIETLESTSTPPMNALRLQVTRPGRACIYLGWRIPPSSSSDTQILSLAAKVLGQAGSGRLHSLVDRGLARNITVQTGVPGGRALNLFLITAEPEEGHTLAEVELALRGEVLRLQEEAVSGEEFQKALRLAELQRLVAEEDPASFAASLGAAWAVLGDWRQALAPPRPRPEARAEEIQRVARLHLTMDRAIVGLVEPDQGLGQDPLDRRLARALRALAQAKGVDPAKAETLVQDGLRQLRMLPREQRAATLKLLEPSIQGPGPSEQP